MLRVIEGIGYRVDPEPRDMVATGSRGSSHDPTPRVVGRYAIYDQIASGGMASVHLGRLLGPVGFSRTVAIKKLHSHLAQDPEFTAMFLDEARLAARIRHPNVVQTLDVVAQQGELFLVMEYVHGESLAILLKLLATRKERVPIAVLGQIMSSVLQGLHAAHEARSNRGERLGIVHRDVSPQNVLVGIDGASHLVDFGVAKAMGRMSTTRGGQIKGKISYMAPEQVLSRDVTRQTDIWGAGVVIWQALVGRKPFQGTNEGATLYEVLESEIDPPSRHVEGVSAELDAAILRALERDPAKRYTTAHDMAVALEQAMPIATQREVAAWVQSVAGEALESRATLVAAIESVSSDLSPTTVRPPAPDNATDASAPDGEVTVTRKAPIPEAASEQPANGETPIGNEGEIGPSRRNARRAVFAGVAVLVALVAVGMSWKLVSASSDRAGSNDGAGRATNEAEAPARPKLETPVAPPIAPAIAATSRATPEPARTAAANTRSRSSSAPTAAQLAAKSRAPKAASSKPAPTTAVPAKDIYARE